MNSYNGQVEQDKFVLKMLDFKKDGYFLELGSQHPIKNNNSYLLETDYNWTGIMIEMDKKWNKHYEEHRKKSKHKICDALSIDFKDLLKDSPKNIDYLQVDLEPSNMSTINVLTNIDKVMDTYRFAVVTFEHDKYRGNFNNTVERSREIFKKNGYKLVFQNIQDDTGYECPFEDWYVHPDLVSNNYVEEVINKNKMNYENGNINYKKIEY
tara:strand:+ start:1632 stop:2261 length:630 start_codon:yes stop_codon:yes gene_type:complete